MSKLKMKNAFPPVTMEFDGAEYVVPSHRVWGLIGTIEEHITYVRLANCLMKNDIPRVKICEAMAAALRYAGAHKITAEDVSGKCDLTEVIGQAIALATILQIAEKPTQEGEADTTPVEGTDAGKPVKKVAPLKTPKSAT